MIINKDQREWEYNSQFLMLQVSLLWIWSLLIPIEKKKELFLIWLSKKINSFWVENMESSSVNCLDVTLLYNQKINKNIAVNMSALIMCLKS